MSNLPASVPARVQSELEHEGCREMPGRTRGETCVLRGASRKFSHRNALLSMANHAALVSMLATHQLMDDAVRMYGVSRYSPDLPTAPASDLTKPSVVSAVDKSSQVDDGSHSNLEVYCRWVPLHRHNDELRT